MVTSPLKISHRQCEERSSAGGREEERDTLISVAVVLTLMAASNGPVPAAGICFSWIRLFFFLWCSRRREKNQYSGARHDRGIISELKCLSAIVIW